MRIALAGPYPLDSSTISGGPQAVFTYLLEGLKAHKELDLHVVSTNKQLAKTREFQQDGVTFHFLPHPRLPFEVVFPVLRRSIRQALQAIGPDIVHAQTGHLYGASCLGTKYPTVVTAHSVPGTEPQFGPDWITRRRLRLHEALTSRTFFAKIRHIISISEYISLALAPRTQATFYPIDNPVANAFFELPLDQAVPGRVLFVGMLRPIKRPDLALEALALAQPEVPELHLKFAGAAVDPSLQAIMRDIISRNSLERSVEFLGHLQQTQLLEAYRRASILLLTSELETSPMAVEQAMAAGTPVVATKVGGVPFLVDNGRTGFLVEPNDPERVARVLIRLARNGELCRTMGQAARQEAIDRFKPERVASKTCAVYRQILNNNGGEML